MQYQQITYDHSNSDGRGNWQLSSPNEFGDTPWLSMNNEHYNETRKQRIKETVEYAGPDFAMTGDRTAIEASLNAVRYALCVFCRSWRFDAAAFAAEGLLAVQPEGLGTFSFVPSLPADMPHLRLSGVYIGKYCYDIAVERNGWSVQRDGVVIATGATDGQRVVIA